MPEGRNRFARAVKWLQVAVPAYGWRGPMTRAVLADILTSRLLRCICCGRTNRDDRTVCRWWPGKILCGECQFGVCEHA